MHIEDLGLQAQPFHRQGQPVTFVQYQAQQATEKFLKQVLEDNRGVGVLYGHKSSGKTTAINQFVAGLPVEIPVAIVNGAQLESRDLLAAILTQLGYKVSIDSASDLMDLLTVIVMQQARAGPPPLLILENINNLAPNALRALCELVALTVNRRFVVRLVLVGMGDYSRITGAPEMSAIGDRLVGAFEMGPLAADEAWHYLHAKLRASGTIDPLGILPRSICNELFQASGGWPGVLDSLAMAAIARAGGLPIRPEHIYQPAAQSDSASPIEFSLDLERKDSEIPRLLITVNGKLLQEFEVRQSKVSIGRALLNDIVMKNRYVSKVHAMLLLDKNTMHIVDLKSSNGVFVNSRRVRSAVLRHDDVVDIGNHRIKIIHRSSVASKDPDSSDSSDTSIMKTIADMRRAVAMRISRIGPAKRHRSN